MSTPPILTAEQRREAYEKALKLRQERSAIKEAVRSGETSFQDAWLHDAVRGMKVLDLLTSVPGVATARGVKFMADAGIQAGKSVRSCGPRQTEKLLALVQKVYDRLHGNPNRPHGRP